MLLCWPTQHLEKSSWVVLESLLKAHLFDTIVLEIELKRIIGEVCKTYEWLLHSIEVMPDHVHIFVQADHTTAPVEIAKTIKSISAVQLFCTFPDLKRRKFWGSGMWSDGTYYGSVGHVSEESVKRYIETQKQRG